ncbi:hypothetical protein [Cytobacillus firmus]|uniref:hypothetical protein n=1 Tax=Cytobacillus firmus TaxID=1399 RepID=UPI0030012C3A
MKKSKLFIMATLLIVLVVGMTACSKSSDETALTKKELESDNRSESTNDSSTDRTVKPQSDELNSSKSNNKEEEGKPSQNFSKPDNDTSTKNQSKSDNTSRNPDSPQSNGSSIESATKSDNSEEKQAIVISSGEKAIQHLKQQLPEGKDDDVSFGVDETLASDDYGLYYTIQLVSISTRASGKTGNLGYYKVYQDGTYKPF